MRRMVVVGLVGGAAVAAAVVVIARRPPGSTLDGEPDWAPLTLTGLGDAGSVPSAPIAVWADTTDTTRTDAAQTSDVVAEAPRVFASDEPSAIEAITATADWVEPDAAGSCPDSHPVKGNRSSRIYHVPGGHFYARTKAERCYCDAEAAEADGYRAAKR